MSALALTTNEWILRIAATWQQSVEAIIETGRLLQQAKDALEHGEFHKMIDGNLPFGPRTAQMLMKVAADPRLTDAKHVSLLPPHWGTLYELSKLPDHEFEARAADGTIRPDMQRADVCAQVKRVHRAEREVNLGAKQRALPQKKYGVIVADPEWHDEVWSDETGMDRHASNHYPTSSDAVIVSRPVADIAARDCVLCLWTTNQHLRIAMTVMEAWGFEYKSNYCWGKDRISLGRWNRSKHELLLIGTRGHPPCPAPGTQWDSLQIAPKGRHSAKPEVFLKMIEEYFPTLPKIELNRRGAPRPGWEAWGNEAGVAGSPHIEPIRIDNAETSLTYTVAGMRDQIDAQTLDILRQADERGLIQWVADGDQDQSVAFVVSVDGKSFEAVRADEGHWPNYETAIEIKRCDGKVEIVAYHDEHNGGRGLVFEKMQMPFDRVAAFLRAWGGVEFLILSEISKTPAPSAQADLFDDGIPECLRVKPKVQTSEVAS